MAQISRQPNPFSDDYGWNAENTPTDEIRAITPYRIVGTSFQGSTVDTNFWASTVANNGTATQSGIVLTLATSATSAGSAIIQSVHSGRYVGGSANVFKGIIATGDLGTTSNTRRWGAFTTTDGAFFELSGTILKCVTRKASSDTPVTITTTATLTNINTYEIYWTNSTVWFSLNGLIVSTKLTTTTGWSDLLKLPIRIENTNGAITTDLTLKIFSATIHRLGQANTEAVYKNITGVAQTLVLKYGPGKIHKVIINSSGGTNIALVDNFTGSTPVICTITTTAINSLDFDCPFFTGLTAITTGDGADITVIYE